MSPEGREGRPREDAPRRWLPQQGPPKRWLIVSYFTGIDGMAASLHTDSRVAELRRRGIEVAVLTSAASPPGPGVLRTVSPFPSGLRFEIRHTFRRRPKTPGNRLAKGALYLLLFPFYALEKLLFRFDPTWSWYLTARLSGRLLAREFRPEVVYSTGGPPSAHLAAAAVVRGSGARWIAEFQDPLRDRRTSRSRLEARHQAAIERTVAAGADAAVWLVEEAKRKSQGRAVFHGRTAVIRAGATGRDPLPPAPPAGGHLVLAHFGTLAGTRNLAGLLAGLGLLREEDPSLAGRIEVLQVGHTDGKVAERARSLDRKGVVRFRGRLPHAEVAGAMEGAHALLLVQDADDVSRESIPSKVYEYLQMGRPILGLVYRNSELAEILLSHGHLAAELTDPDAVARALRELADRLEGRRPPFALLRSDLTVASAVDRLIALVE